MPPADQATGPPSLAADMIRGAKGNAHSFRKINGLFLAELTTVKSGSCRLRITNVQRKPSLIARDGCREGARVGRM